jgi:hypothetical protein
MAVLAMMTPLPEEIDPGFQFDSEAELTTAVAAVNRVQEFLALREANRCPVLTEPWLVPVFQVDGKLVEGQFYNYWNGTWDQVVDYTRSCMAENLAEIRLKGGWKSSNLRAGYTIHRWQVVVWRRQVKRRWVRRVHDD